MRYFALIGDNRFEAYESSQPEGVDYIEMTGPAPSINHFAYIDEDENAVFGVWKLKETDTETEIKELNKRISEQIVAGFSYDIPLGKINKKSLVYSTEMNATKVPVTFEYDIYDQQNFLDNLQAFIHDEFTSVEMSVLTEEGNKILVDIPKDLFIEIYYKGALKHKNSLLSEGRRQKQKLLSN